MGAAARTATFGNPDLMARERFNVWAAYVDVLSTLLALFMVAGMIATASALGGRANGTCGLNDDSGVSRQLRELRRLTGSGTDPQGSGVRCESVLLPDRKPGMKQPGGFMDYLVFARHSTTPCFKTGGSGCPPSIHQTQQSPDLDKLCDHLLAFIRAARNPEEDFSEYRVIFRGHTSIEWKDGCGFTDKQADKAFVCNMDLGARRSFAVFNYCYARWSPHLSPDDKKILLRAVVIESAGNLDKSVNQTFQDENSRRRVTVALVGPLDRD
ncbi:MAG TPA: hypothetical protein VGF56_11230 [Rhizomicrobium sp.]|jgi:hypothetical protein